nr:immunoglobulin light chain junction region [Macaca mulatta]
CQQYDSEPRTF